MTGDQVWGLSGAVVSYFSIFGGKEQGVMVSLETPVCEFDAAVPDFELANLLELSEFAEPSKAD